MRWQLQFYNERDAIVAGYDVEASTPTAAVQAGRDALRAEHPTIPKRRRVSGYTQAQRLGGHDASGWILYRIVKADVGANRLVDEGLIGTREGVEYETTR